MPGGRPYGSRSPQRVKLRQKITELVEKYGGDPFEYMVRLIGNKKAGYDLRLQAAREIAQYLEPKLRAVEISGDPDKPLKVLGTVAEESAKVNDLLRQLGEIGVYSGGAIRDANRDERTSRESAPVA